MVSTRSSHQNLPTIAEHSPPPDDNIIQNVPAHPRHRSKSPAEPTFMHSPSAIRSAISEFPTAFLEPSYLGNTSSTLEPPAQQLHNSSDLLTSPSTIVVVSANTIPGAADEEGVSYPNQFRSDKLNTPGFEAQSPIPPKDAEEEDEPKAEIQLQRDMDADIEAHSEASNVMPENLEVNSTPSQMPVGRSSESLRSFIVGSRQLLKIEEEKLDEMYKPESGDVLLAHQEMDGFLSQYEKAKREYEWRKMQQEAYSTQQVEIRNRRRQLDEAERELDDLCH